MVLPLKVGETWNRLIYLFQIIDGNECAGVSWTLKFTNFIYFLNDLKVICFVVWESLIFIIFHPFPNTGFELLQQIEKNHSSCCAPIV